MPAEEIVLAREFVHQRKLRHPFDVEVDAEQARHARVHAVEAARVAPSGCPCPSGSRGSRPRSCARRFRRWHCSPGRAAQSRRTPRRERAGKEARPLREGRERERQHRCVLAHGITRRTQSPRRRDLPETDGQRARGTPSALRPPYASNQPHHISQNIPARRRIQRTTSIRATTSLGGAAVRRSSTQSFTLALAAPPAAVAARRGRAAASRRGRWTSRSPRRCLRALRRPWPSRSASKSTP